MRKDKDNANVKIYRRLLKYSPFVPRRKDGVMKIIHHLKGNRRIKATAPEYVSVSDVIGSVKIHHIGRVKCTTYQC